MAFANHGAALFSRNAHHNAITVVKRGDCKTGGFYISPYVGQSVDALTPLELKWDTSCLSADTTKVDIYLYAPKTTTPLLHEFEGVDYKSGTYTAELMPRWWNATSAVDLQIGIIAAGNPLWMNDMPAGPVFTANYAAPSSGAPASADTNIKDASGITAVGAAADAHASLGKGKTAAAVLVPLLFIIALGTLLWIKFKRGKQEQKTLAFSEKVDKRMSVMSGDWKSMTPSGAKEVVRASMYQQDSTSRFSTFSYGTNSGNRSSTFATEGSAGSAGVGSRGIYQQDNGTIGDFDYVNGYNGSNTTNKSHTPRQRSNATNVMRPSFTQSRVSFADSLNNPPAVPRPGAGAIGEGQRQSRVSFADGTRPSVDRSSRAFHSSYNVGDEDVPPVPQRKAAEDLVLSPKQRHGAPQLTPTDISSKMSQDDEDVGAAISYIQSPMVGGDSQYYLDGNQSDVLFSVPQTPGPFTAGMPSPPGHTYSPSSPGAGMFARQQLDSSYVTASPLPPTAVAAPPPKYMSPDEMLRAYATRSNSVTGGGGPVPMERADSIDAGRMRGSAW